MSTPVRVHDLHREPLVRRGLAFAAGMGFAAVPTVGPYLAMLGIVAGRIEAQRPDRWWWAASLLLGLPWIVQGHTWLGLGATGQGLAVWLIFRSASELRRSFWSTTVAGSLSAGLLLGFTGALALGLRQAGTWRLESANSAFDLIAWSSSPALFGHAMVVLAALLAVVLPSAWHRTVALALGAGAVLVSGAHEAVLTWLVVAIGLRLIGGRGSRRTAATEWILIAVMVTVASGVTQPLGLGRTGYRVEVLPAAGSVNLFRGTEFAAGEWWYPLGVAVAETDVVVGGQSRTGYEVTKAEEAHWSRLQQIVVLRPGSEYVLAVAWQADAGAEPGLDGWGRLGDGSTANLAATRRGDHWLAAATAHFTILASGTMPLDDGWTRGHVAFRYEGVSPLTWYVGAVPDRSRRIGATATFAEFQLVEGADLVPYAPNAADVRLADLRTTRLPLLHQAVEAISARPLAGWGPRGFTTATAVMHPDAALYRPVVAHAHNLVLDVWVERGAIGVVGLLLLVGAMALRAVQQRDREMILVLIGVALLNLFETTFVNGAVMYPLAAVLGWRAVVHRRTARVQSGLGTAATVRLSMAATDIAVAGLGISLGLATVHDGSFVQAVMRGWTPGLAYATLLWPAFAWANGLYPGYGLPLHGELARSVRASAAAGVCLGFTTLLLPDLVPLGTRGVLVTAAFVLVTAPVSRAGAKHLLRLMQLWGRPVVVLGGGPTAARVVRYLLEYPGVGLQPVAIFATGPWEGPRLSVIGRLEEAWEYLATHDVRHAVITADAAAEVGFDDVLRRADRVLRYVQFLPDLPGLPAASLTAAPLGTSLALEVRNELASSTNRAVKRILDAVGAVTLLALLTPALAAIALWVRIDSAGPALYSSPRIGRYGQTFACLKFRTMFVDAEDHLDRLIASDGALREEYDCYHKIENDPRITRAGRWLRRLSLDELPQLINVVTGEMSLVGPRPYLVRELHQMGQERDLVLLARPGMTGYWQISARNSVTFADRQAMEAHYVRNWSVWWDVELLLRTPAALARRTGR
jgi:Undecaprenyl-phosphate galactose phosphotransferase WbaP